MIALLPRKLGEMLGGDKIVLRSRIESRVDYRCHLSWNRDRQYDPAVNWLVGVLRDRFTTADVRPLSRFPNWYDAVSTLAAFSGLTCDAS